MAPAFHFPGSGEFGPIIQGGITGLGTISGPPEGGITPIQNAANITSDAAGVTDFLGRLTNPNTWIRVGEFGVGLILLYVGVRTLFPSQVSAVTTPVKTVAKAGALAA